MSSLECRRLGSKKKKNLTDMQSGAKKIDEIAFDTPEFQQMSAVFINANKEGGLSEESLFRLSILARDLEIESLFWQETAEQRQSTTESYLRVLDFLRRLPDEFYRSNEDTGMAIVLFWERLLWTDKEIAVPDEVRASFKLDCEEFERFRERREKLNQAHYSHSPDKNPYLSSVVYRWFVSILQAAFVLSLLVYLVRQVGLLPQSLTALPSPFSSSDVLAATAIALCVDYFFFSDVRAIEDEMQVDAVMQRTIAVCSQMKRGVPWIPFIDESSASKKTQPPSESLVGEEGEEVSSDGLRLRSGFPLK